MREMNDFRHEYPCDGGLVVDKRNGGCAAVVGDKVYVWGGQTEDKVSLRLPSLAP